MIQRDYLIIGSGVGGSSVCESIRKYDKRGQVTLVGAETFAPYKRWILSKTFLRDKIAPLKKMPVLDPHWYEKHKIETRFGALEITALLVQGCEIVQRHGGVGVNGTVRAIEGGDRRDEKRRVQGIRPVVIRRQVNGEIEVADEAGLVHNYTPELP